MQNYTYLCSKNFVQKRKQKQKNRMECKVIAHIKTDFVTKFGVPRQSGLVPELMGKIIFEPEYRVAEALRGLEGYSHLWLIWEFSGVTATRDERSREWTPTVRPPRLGGNVRMGVFATRSPFRPNPIGLSSVEIERIELSTPEGPVIYVRGADLMDGTPILDLKPYLPFTDSHPQARGGFTTQTYEQKPLNVIIPDTLYTSYNLNEAQWQVLRKVLSQDPRPHYQHDDTRVYGIEFASHEFHFTIKDDVLTVCE